MKNIHILPTSQPSRLHYNEFEELVFTPKSEQLDGVNIYITSDEEIKEGDWVLFISTNEVTKVPLGGFKGKVCKKIILTTDQDLIKDGVQEIDDEFLEWFIKNPSCEEVEIDWVDFSQSYFIKIPKEEPKQDINTCKNFDIETGCDLIDCPCENEMILTKAKESAKQQEKLEEAGVIAVSLSEHLEAREQAFFIAGFQECIKFQQKRMYSEEEVVELLQWLTDDNSIYSIMYGHKKYRFSTNDKDFTSKEILKQFKKK